VGRRTLTSPGRGAVGRALFLEEAGAGSLPRPSAARPPRVPRFIDSTAEEGTMMMDPFSFSPS